MRHRKAGRHLNRTSSHRKAMLSNMSASLIDHEIVKTTAVKAKELRRHVEPLIALARDDSVANRRLAFARLRSKASVGKLFTELGPRYAERPGGYTRILKAGYRRGDSAMVAYVELVDRPAKGEDDEPSVRPRTVAQAAEAETAVSTPDDAEPAADVEAREEDERAVAAAQEQRDDATELTQAAGEPEREGQQSEADTDSKDESGDAKKS